jgi:hypothetical protein
VLVLLLSGTACREGECYTSHTLFFVGNVKHNLLRIASSCTMRSTSQP